MSDTYLYKHPVLGTKLIKNGFSWSAFLAPPVWMFFHKLWSLLIIWIFAASVCSVFTAAIDNSAESISKSLSYIFVSVGYFALALIPGIQGRKWLAKDLLRRGFIIDNDGIDYRADNIKGYDSQFDTLWSSFRRNYPNLGDLVWTIAIVVCVFISFIPAINETSIKAESEAFTRREQLASLAREKSMAEAKKNSVLFFPFQKNMTVELEYSVSDQGKPLYIVIPEVEINFFSSKPNVKLYSPIIRKEIVEATPEKYEAVARYHLSQLNYEDIKDQRGMQRVINAISFAVGHVCEDLGSKGWATTEDFSLSECGVDIRLPESYSIK